MNKIKSLIFLHLIIILYALSSVCSKFASKCEFFSFKWIMLYGLLIFFLGVYALLWQQVLKRLPLNLAYANKAVTVAWGMLFGVLIFKETVEWNNILGAGIVLCGVILMVTSQEKSKVSDSGKKEDSDGE